MSANISISPEELMHAVCTVKEWYPQTHVKAVDGRLEFHMDQSMMPCAVICLCTGKVTIAKPENVYVASYPIQALKVLG